MTLVRHQILLLALAASLGLSMIPAQAQISVTFTPDTQSGIPGATLNYSADFTDTDTVPYYIDGASFTSGSPYVNLLYSFFNGDPVNGDPITGAFEVMPGQPDSITDVFSLTLDSTLPVGSYLGTVTFTGQTASDYTSGTGTDTTIGFQDLTAVATAPQGSSVPEPSSAIQSSLLMILAGYVCRAYKRNQRKMRPGKVTSARYEKHRVAVTLYYLSIPSPNRRCGEYQESRACGVQLK